MASKTDYVIEFQLRDGNVQILSTCLPKETFLVSFLNDSLAKISDNMYVFPIKVFTVSEFNEFLQCIQGNIKSPKSEDRLKDIFMYMGVPYHKYFHELTLSENQKDVRDCENDQRKTLEQHRYMDNILEPVYEPNTNRVSFDVVFRSHKICNKFIMPLKCKELTIRTKNKAREKIQPYNMYVGKSIFDGQHELANARLNIAGGFVLGCITFSEYQDIDIFLVGVDRDLTEHESKTVVDFIISNTPHHLLGIVRTECAITFKYRNRTTYNIVLIQLILKGYASLQHVLIGFDIDCCCFGYDGDTFYMLPRGKQFLQDIYKIHGTLIRANLVDHERRSPTYEQRLIKYCNRGFAILILHCTTKEISFDRVCFSSKYKLSGIERLIHYSFYRQEESELINSGGNICKFLKNGVHYQYDVSICTQYAHFNSLQIIPWFIVSDNSNDICSSHKIAQFDILKITINQTAASFNPLNTDDWFEKT